MEKLRHVIFFTLAIPLISFVFACNQGNRKNTSSPTSKNKSNSSNTRFLSLKSTIGLPEVNGGFDLMSLDITGKRLFVSAQDNHSLEVIDLKAEKALQSVSGLNEPKWSFYLPEKNEIYVACGGDGKVIEMNASTFNTIKEFQFKEACNNLRYDKVSNQLWVGIGQSFGALGVIDLDQDKIIREIPLSGYLKQFELDGNRVYVNIPGKNQVDVVGRKKNKVTDVWPVKLSEQNVSMALDTANQRLFVGCDPGKLIIISTETGLPVTEINISKGADGIYFDKKRSLIYVSCGEGYIDIIKQNSADHYQAVEKIKTKEGAATSFYSPELDELFLAVPQTANQQAAIRIYQPTN
ncbi:MAG: hypothetical protein BGO69_14910 [Bacteroidetes bacterium 46-16]|nr:MAG: hypothetical protein BGO69_14910 [Bacteroidetes bacterium 46-16]